MLGTARGEDRSAHHLHSPIDKYVLGYPLGNTKAILPSAMVNIIGDEGFSGNVKYEGLEEVLKIDNAFVHLYGKAQTRPGRKMGHVTIVDADREKAIEKARFVQETLKVIS